MTESQPDKVVAYLLGNEDEHSLLEQLKKDKLAKSIEAGDINLSSDTAFFSVQIELTEQGMANPNAVIEKCFEAIALFREKEVPEYIFNDIKRLGTLHYQYQPRSEVFQKIGSLINIITHEKLETFPEHSSIIQTFNPQAIKDLLNQLTPDNVIITLMARYPADEIKAFKKEKWMGVEYEVIPISKEDLLRWSEASPSSDVVLPAPNPFIPTHLSLITDSNTPLRNSSGIPQPVVAIDNDSMKIYCAPDSRFQDPRYRGISKIKTPQIDASNPSKVVLGEVLYQTAE